MNKTILITLLSFTLILGSLPYGEASNFKMNSEPVANITIQDSTLQQSIARGAEIYTGFCMQCHMENGKGVTKTIPPLAHSDYLIKQKQASIKAIKYGLSEEIVVNGETYHSAMPQPGLYDSEIADVMNYILNSWGNEHDVIITEAEVAEITED